MAAAQFSVSVVNLCPARANALPTPSRNVAMIVLVVSAESPKQSFFDSGKQQPFKV